MKFEDYINERARIFAKQFANKECMNIIWASVSLGGEVGEFLNEVKKINRDDAGRILPDRLQNMKDELGDVFWYLIFVCNILKLNPESVMENNLDKLKKRYGIK